MTHMSHVLLLFITSLQEFPAFAYQHSNYRDSGAGASTSVYSVFLQRMNVADVAFLPETYLHFVADLMILMIGMVFL